jgi:hypothetical protein
MAHRVIKRAVRRQSARLGNTGKPGKSLETHSGAGQKSRRHGRVAQNSGGLSKTDALGRSVTNNCLFTHTHWTAHLARGVVVSLVL